MTSQRSLQSNCVCEHGLLHVQVETRKPHLPVPKGRPVATGTVMSYEGMGRVCFDALRAVPA